MGKIRDIMPVLMFCFMLLACAGKDAVRIEYVQGDNNLLIKKEYRNDTLLSKVSYLSDTNTKEGKAHYYEQGQLSKVMHYKKGVLAGSHIEYYKSGKPSLFICHDTHGDTVFIRSYDKDGTILYEEGDMTTLGFISDDDVKTGQILRYNSFVINAPYTSVSIDNYLLYNGSKDTLRPVREIISYDWIHTYLFKVSQQGTYKYKQRTLIVDSIKQKGYSIKDSVIKNVNW